MTPFKNLSALNRISSRKEPRSILQTRSTQFLMTKLRLQGFIAVEKLITIKLYVAVSTPRNNPHLYICVSSLRVITMVQTSLIERIQDCMQHLIKNSSTIKAEILALQVQNKASLVNLLALIEKTSGLLHSRIDHQDF